MEAFFNELSLNETSLYLDDSDLSSFDIQMQRLISLYHSLKDAGIGICRINVDCLSSIIKIANECSMYKNDTCGLLYSFFQTPFESDNVNKYDDEYLIHKWAYERDNECYGLALAHILDSLTISIGDVKWNKAFITIFKDADRIDVRNAYSTNHISDHKEWLESLGCVELVKCNLEYSKKSIVLRHDHGENILRCFAEKIVKNQYVCEVINSLPYNSASRKFIHGIKPNGIIEIVLPWTDKGLGMVIKTTGRNIRETTAIADILKQEYGKY